MADSKTQGMPLNPKTSALIRTGIVEQLAGGQFCSGEALGALFNVSRSAISKHIKQLSDLGLDIYSVTGKGYRLARPLALLSKTRIQALQRNAQDEQLAVVNVIDSTNQYIKDRQGQLTKGFACLAEAQTAGRGRHGRSWFSPFGASLYLSIYWPFAGGYQAIGGLSLMAGVAVCRALQAFGVHDAKLKWPNDVYIQHKKLAGILIEVEGQLGASCDCIIGIGLNVTLPSSLSSSDIGQPFIDLFTVLQTSPDRNKLAALLLDELIEALELFEREGLRPFLAAWREADVYANQAIKLLMGQQTIEGICRGINESGALLLETNAGLRAFQGGEISVRSA
jgi:BirA family transcriptional regulator, biotin operon repressor / biotin---[acetyl-CoA-carboxylase] ligase